MDVVVTSAAVPAAPVGRGVDLRQWRYFMALTRHRSFSRAAAALGVSQPTLSQQIKELERRVGAALFVRDRQGVRPTPAGDRLVEPVRRLFAEAEAVERTVRAVVDHPEPVAGLQVAYAVAVRHPALGPAVRFLRRSMPGASVTSGVGTAGAQLARLRRGDVDVAFVQAPGSPDPDPFGPDLVATSMGDVPLVVAVSPGHRLAARCTVPAAALATERELLLPPEPEPGLWQTLLSGILAAGTVRTSSPEPDEGQLLDAVAADGGVALVGQATADARGGEDVAVRRLEDPLPAVPTYLVRSRARVPAAVLLLEERLQQRIVPAGALVAVGRRPAVPATAPPSAAPAALRPVPGLLPAPNRGRGPVCCR